MLECVNFVGTWLTNIFPAYIVFVDEVHERDLNTDFLLIILRALVQRRKSLKLVLMVSESRNKRVDLPGPSCLTNIFSA